MSRILPELASVQQALAIIYNLCHFPAVTVMVFLRRRLGYRTVNLPVLLISCFVLWTLGWVAFILSVIRQKTLPFPMNFIVRSSADFWVLLFAVVVLFLGLWNRRKRWQEIANGQLWYSYSRGTSRLIEPLSRFAGTLPLTQQRIEGIVEPLVCVVVGMIVFQLGSSIFGFWLILAGLCLAICEAITIDQIRTRLLDTMDSLLIVAVQQEDMKFFNNAAKYSPEVPQQKEAGTPEEAGLPTDHQADDIQRKLERRRKRLEEGSTKPDHQ